MKSHAKYGGRGSTGLDATPTVLIHICHRGLGDLGNARGIDGIDNVFIAVGYGNVLQRLLKSY